MNQIVRPISTSDISEVINPSCNITDYALLNGSKCFNMEDYKNHKSPYWINTKYSPYVYDESKDFKMIPTKSSEKDKSFRFTVKYSYFKNFCKHEYQISDKVLIVSCGLYPERCSGGRELYDIEILVRYGCYKLTGKNYKCGNNIYEEYLINDNKYICVPSHKKLINNNGDTVMPYDNNWIRVLPLRWIVDLENDIMVTKDAIVSGISYDEIDDYLENEFLNEILDISYSYHR